MVKFYLRDRWKIHQKIGYGYGVAIAIGLIGSLSGMLVADYFQGQGLNRLEDAQQQSKLLADFARQTETFTLYATRLGSLSPGTQDFEGQYARMQVALEQAEVLRYEIEGFLNNDPSWVAGEPDPILQTIDGYIRYLVDCQNQFEAGLLDAAIAGESDVLNQKLASLVSGEVATQLDDYHDAVIEISAIARAQEQRASLEMETAQGLEKLIIVVSIFGSTAIAGVLAWQATRAIANPLEQVTQVAQQAAQQSDFSLRAKVTSDDEIGVLAQSLNALIERVAQYTQELEQSATEATLQADKLSQTLNVLRRTQTQLVQTEKMSSLGQMVAGIAHEINNPVSFIYGNISYIQQYVQDLLRLVDAYEQAYPERSPELQQCYETLDLEFLREDLPKLLSSLTLGSERIRSIVLSLRIFSRLDEADIKTVNLHDGLDSTLIILNNRLKAQPNRPEIQIIKDYDRLPLVECYPGHLNQVFMNVLANAIDALEERYQHETQTNAAPSSWQPKLILKTEQTNGYIHIVISDNGCGISDAIRDKIFDPFFTTKPVGQGTGLGMSISYEIIVKKHLGSIDVWSTSGEGTTFRIELPLNLGDRTAEG
jgi:signal transduction histidine kinase